MISFNVKGSFLNSIKHLVEHIYVLDKFTEIAREDIQRGKKRLAYRLFAFIDKY